MNKEYPVTAISNTRQGTTIIFAISSSSVISATRATMPIDIITTKTPMPTGLRTCNDIIIS